MRTVEVDLELILELISCADDYGYRKSILLSGFAEMVGELTDADIEEYVARFTTPEYLAQGYSEEDADNARECLSVFRSEYLRPTPHFQKHSIP
jgi:hypothetical protein